MTSDVVAVEYELTREDWVAAVARYIQRSGTSRRALRAFRLAFGLAVATLALLLLWDGALAGAIIAALFGAGWVAATPSVTRWSQRRQLRRIADEGVANGTFGRHRVVLTDEGILDSAEGFDWLIHWDAVERVEDGGNALLVYNGLHSFLAIPLHAFPDRATFEAFSDRFFRGLEESDRLAALARSDPATEASERDGTPARP